MRAPSVPSRKYWPFSEVVQLPYASGINASGTLPATPVLKNPKPCPKNPLVPKPTAVGKVRGTKDGKKVEYFVLHHG